RVPAALAFVRASAEANRLAGVCLVAGDATTPGLRGPFELVLGAELLYDRAALPALARGLGRMLAGDGRALIADARRTDTGAFYAALDALGLRWQACEHLVHEDRLPSPCASSRSYTTARRSPSSAREPGALPETVLLDLAVEPLAVDSEQ